VARSIYPPGTATGGRKGTTGTHPRKRTHVRDIIDATRPNVARVYDCLAGGKAAFAVDRALAREMEAMHPPLRALVAANRAFLARAVIWAARQGISQFVDLGAGLPSAKPLHQAAREADPSARYCYVDNDPLCGAHARILLAADGVGVAETDLTDPGGVLAHPDLLAVVSPRLPVLVLLGCVLNALPAGEAAEVVAGYTRLLAPGSVIAISALRIDDKVLWKQLHDTYTAGPLHNHGREDIATWLGGLDVVPPGIVLAHVWRGGMPDPGLRQAGPACVLAVAGRVRAPASAVTADQVVTVTP